MQQEQDKNIRLLSLFLLCCLSFQFSRGQEVLPDSIKYKKHSVAAFDNWLKKAYSIRMEVPEGFKDLYALELFPFGPLKGGTTGAYGPIMESEDGECVLIYSWIPLYIEPPIFGGIEEALESINAQVFGCEIQPQMPRDYRNRLFARGQTYSNLQTAWGTIDKNGYGHDDEELLFDDHVTIVAGHFAHSHFNADTVYVSPIPMKTVFKEKYTLCTGISFMKENFAGIQVFFFFTEKGKAKEQEYLMSLFGKIKYLGEEWDENEMFNYKEELKFFL
ncbi:hypothetical protein M2137_002789 [Parabacteroides sp. PFB2-10]|uniref:hypothetical protein n=1 Tax=Parabacteroides sp. PFB2-10 TaxID=1742405 RepID=UPI002474222E|nr:hypothetical protein [Parabacteroides sp. PFB2-10]MDH6313996.1 hypothetical protein [Parabacteroides sp. PFB2-10]